MRLISTCRTKLTTARRTSRPSPLFPVSAFPQCRPLLVMIASRVGQAHCFRQSQSNSPIPARAVRRQIGRKSRAHRAYIQWRHHRMTVVCSCRDRRNGGRNDRFDRLSHRFAEWSVFGREAWERSRPADGWQDKSAAFRLGASGWSDKEILPSLRTLLPALPIDTLTVSKRSPPSPS
jgi:hypothetical protein